MDATQADQPTSRSAGLAVRQRLKTTPNATVRTTALQQQLSACRQELQTTRAALAASLVREAQALHVAGHDPLTGLPNRRAFDLHSRAAVQLHAAQAQRLCLMFIDLDGFKAVNDRIGHAAGDELLNLIGERLRQALRRDDFVSRHGGDEFLCLLPRLSGEPQALGLARQLIASIARPCQLGAYSVAVQASIGLALYPRDGRTVEQLLDNADAAMRRAKLQRSGLALAS
jgi:diguanylate cyclase (GGDEF)-like protein